MATEQDLSVTERESTAATEALLKQKVEELNRLKELKAKKDKEAAEKAAAAAQAEAEKKAKTEAEKKAREAVLPGSIPPETMPHWRTYVPACGVIIAARESIGMTYAETAFAIFCLLISVFLGQQLMNRIENSQWRRNLRLMSESRTTLPKDDKSKPKAAGNPKKSKKAD
jgi:hypothetical protein